MFSAVGTPGGNSRVLEVAGALVLEADPMKITHTSSDRNSGIAMRAVAGIWRIGMMPGRLQR
jgi:hypothetical protein